MSEKDFYLYIGGKPVKVSKEVYQEYYRGERKEKYFMEDLKMEQMEFEPETQTVRLIPSREDSYERLVEAGKQFGTPCAPLEDSVLLSVLLESMIHSLSPEEQEVIRELYYLDKTERDLCALFHVSQNTIHYRKTQALKKLKELFEKNF